jgi:hypothetical protein
VEIPIPILAVEIPLGLGVAVVGMLMGLTAHKLWADVVDVVS